MISRLKSKRLIGFVFFLCCIFGKAIYKTGFYQNNILIANNNPIVKNLKLDVDSIYISPNTESNSLIKFFMQNFRFSDYNYNNGKYIGRFLRRNDTILIYQLKDSLGKDVNSYKIHGNLFEIRNYQHIRKMISCDTIHYIKCISGIFNLTDSYIYYFSSKKQLFRSIDFNINDLIEVTSPGIL